MQQCSDDVREKIAKMWYKNETNTSSSNKITIETPSLLAPTKLFCGMSPSEEIGLEIIRNIAPVLEEMKKEIEDKGMSKSKSFGRRYHKLTVLGNRHDYLSSSQSIVLPRRGVTKAFQILLPRYKRYTSQR